MLKNNRYHSTSIISRLLLFLYLAFLTTWNTVHSKSNFISDNWLQISPGLKYKNFKSNQLSPFSNIHTFDIDPNKIKFNYCSTDPLTNVAQSSQKFNALLTFNSGFFSKEFETLGLRINNHRTTSKLKKISWWGVFYIKNNKAYIKSTKSFKNNKKITFAVQAGPRLLINSHIPKLKGGNASRTALAINKKGHIILVITEFTQITTTFLADFLKNELNCLNALNLDGGGSTQLYVNQTALKYHVLGITKLPDPICLFNQQN